MSADEPAVIYLYANHSRELRSNTANHLNLNTVKLNAFIITAAIAIGNASAAVILSTDFANTGVDGNGDMTGIVWTTNGLTAPTTIGAFRGVNNVNVANNKTGTVDAAGGFFSGDANVNGSTVSSPAWSTTWAITVGTNDIDLASIVLASAEANNGGVLDAGNGSSNINLTISGTAINQTQLRSGNTTPVNLTYTTPVTLLANTSYDVTFTVYEGASSGHYEGFDSVIFNGTVIPEPSTAFLSIAGLGLLMARRRRS